MTAVLTAIAGALLGGAIALYRERRKQLAKLLVASRVVGSLASEVSGVFRMIGNTAAPISDEVEIIWYPVVQGFTKTWDKHRNVLAQHLRIEEWNQLVEAARGLAILETEKPATTRSQEVRDYFGQVGRQLDTCAETLSRYGQRPGWINNPGRKSSAPRT